MIKFLVVSFLVLFSTKGMTFAFQDLSVDKDLGKFFVSYDNTLISYKHATDQKVFGDLNSKPRVRLVDLKSLPLDLKAGDVVRTYSFKTQKVSSYKLKDKVNILLFRKISGTRKGNLWERYNLILTDDQVELDKWNSGTDGPVTNGISYVGTKIDFDKIRLDFLTFNQEQGLVQQIPFAVDPKKEVLLKTTWGVYDLFATIKRKKSDELNQEIYDSLIVRKSPKLYYHLGVFLPFLLEKSASSLIGILRVTSETFLVPTFDPTNENSYCRDIIIFNKDKISKADVLCSGDWSFDW